jgi:hypothetical protein
MYDAHIQKAIAVGVARTPMSGIRAPTISQTPLYIETDHITYRKPAIANGTTTTTTNATQLSFSGNGTARGIDYTDNGKAIMIPRENGVIVAKVYVTMKTSSDDRASATFQEIGHPVVDVNNNNNVMIAASGTAFFDSKATGKIAFLSNAVAIYKDIIYKNGTDKVIAWDWK